MAALIQLAASALPSEQITRMGVIQPGTAGQVHCLAFSPMDGCLAAGGEDGVIRLWQVETGHLLRELHGHEVKAFESAGITSIAFSPDGRKLLSGGWDDTTRLWDVSSGAEVFCHDLHVDDSMVTSVAYSSDGRTLATAGYYATIALRDGETGREIHNLRGEKSNSSGLVVDWVTFLRDGKTLAAGYRHSIQIWDVLSGLMINEIPVRTRHQPLCTSCVSLSPDGSHLAVGSDEDPPILLLDTTTWCEVMRLQHARVASLAYTPDGALLVSAGGLDRTIRVWDTAFGELLLQLEVELPVYALACSQDGTRIAHGLNDGSIAVWRRAIVPLS